MIELLLLVLFTAVGLTLAGIADRVRGGWKGPGGVLKNGRQLPVLFEGLVFFFLTLTVLGFSAIIPAVIAGSIAGLWSWRQDNGWRGRFVHGNEGYDPNDNHRWYYPIRFGAWQGFWFFPLVVFNPAFGFLINACIAGQVLAMYLSEKIWPTHVEDGRVMEIKNAWPGSEFLGPVCTGAFWILFLVILSFLGVDFS